MQPITVALLLSLTGASLLPWWLGCGEARAGAVTTGSVQDAREASLPPDRPLRPFQEELLDLAFKAASAFPRDPHEKNRARTQESVVTACLELDQPGRALRLLQQIEGWRRGAAYAELALWGARHGADRDLVQQHLEMASRIAEEHAAEENAQEWRRDRIRAKVAATYLLLGQTARAREVGPLVDSEAGGVLEVQAELLGADEFDRHVEALGAVFESGSFEQIRSAHNQCAELFRRFYTEEERRSRVEALVVASFEKLPPPVRVELLAKLAGFALDHGDAENARHLLDDAEREIEAARWQPEDRIALAGRLSGLRHRAGQAQRARQAADGALAIFEAERSKIANIYRAGALRPVAEAYFAMGDAAQAMTVYAWAAEESLDNPNSRPRAEDLVATCLSLARHGIEPNAELRLRLRQIGDGLRDPW